MFLILDPDEFRLCVCTVSPEFSCVATVARQVASMSGATTAPMALYMGLRRRTIAPNVLVGQFLESTYRKSYRICVLLLSYPGFMYESTGSP